MLKELLKQYAFCEMLNAFCFFFAPIIIKVLTTFGVEVYISPSKALVQEKLRDWNQKFNSWGISCLELTGDNETYSSKNIQDADIILTTPEVRSQLLFLVSVFTTLGT